MYKEVPPKIEELRIPQAKYLFLNYQQMYTWLKESVEIMPTNLKDESFFKRLLQIGRASCRERV